MLLSPVSWMEFKDAKEIYINPAGCFPILEITEVVASDVVCLMTLF